jgi:hypothetical protein
VAFEGDRGNERDTQYVHVCRLLADALDPILPARGFAAGQTGLHPDDDSRELGPFEGPWPDQSGSIIWCAPGETFQQRYPSLPQAHGNGLGVDYDCIDLTVTIASGNITEIDFEGLSLAETFSAVGRQKEGDAADRLLGKSAEAVNGPLRELLTRLLEPPRGRRSRAPCLLRAPPVLR